METKAKLEMDLTRKIGVNSKTIAIMKKMIKNLMLVAVAAMGFTACNDSIEEATRPIEPAEVEMTITADVDETRTWIDEANSKVQWSEGDKLKVIENGATYRTTKAATIDANGLAKFTVSFPENTTATEFTYNAIYPATQVVEEENVDKINAAKIKVIMPDAQNPTATSFDPTADILVAKQIVTDAQPTELSMQFKRLVAMGKMTLTNLPESSTISKVIFTVEDTDAEEQPALAGRNYVDATTGTVQQYGYYGATNTITLNYNEPISTRDIYFTCNPFELGEGDKFTVKVVCSDATYTREVTLPEGKTLGFIEGDLSKFSVNMKDAERVENIGISLPWTENFDSEDLSKYDIVNGASNTKVYPDDNLAGGAAKGEILIGKDGGSMAATFESDGKAKTLNLWFKSNKDVITVSSDTEGVTVTKLTSTGYTVALTDGVSKFKITIANNNPDTNARVDDITLTEEAPTVEAITISGATMSFTAGEEFVFDGTVTAIYQNGVSKDVTEDATVDNSDVDMTTAGTYTVTVTYNGISATYDITIQAAGVKTNTIELGNGTFANSVITWEQDDVTVVQAKGNGSTAVNKSYVSASNMRLYQGHTLTFTCDYNITKIELFTTGKYYGPTATADVGTLNNPKTEGCTITWTGSAKKIVITNGTGSGGDQIRTTKILITYEISGDSGETPAPSFTVSPNQDQTIAADGGSIEFTVEALNGAVVSATSSADWLTLNGYIATATANNTGANRSATITFSAESCDDVIVTVSQDAQSTGEDTNSIKYTKITSLGELTDGEYIIVYENGNNAYVYNGKDAVNGYTDATVSNGSITTDEAFAGEVTIAAMSGGYSLKVAGGYMYGTSGSNKLNFNSTTAQANTISFENDGSAKITSNTSVLRFNAAKDQMRFRYFKSSSYTGQKAVALYKKN